MGSVVPSLRPTPLKHTWGLIPLVIAAPLIVAASTGQPFAWEVAALLALHRQTTPPLDNAAVWWSRLFHPQVLLVAATLLTVGFVLRRAWCQACATIGSVGGALLLSTLVKRLVDRPRPALWPALVVETNSGFPSGHAMTCCAVAALLVLIAWRTRWRIPVLVIAVAWAALVALARLYLGAHYPTDVIAGWCLALSWVALVSQISGAWSGGRGIARAAA